MPAARKSTARKSTTRKSTTKASTRKSASASRRSTSFKEPAALKQLNRSLDSAVKAVADLRKHTGSGVSKGARDAYKDLRTFVSSAQSNTRKLGKALARDFDEAQKGVARSRSAAKSSARATGSRTRKSRPAASRRKTSSR